MKRPDWHPKQRINRWRRSLSLRAQRLILKFGLLDAGGMGCFIVAGFLWHAIAGWIVAGTSVLAMSYRLGGNE